ncbi:hypothetical protein PsAD13_03644 [Pseudovibrio sp. Ad13]|nr:hypothetical protein PsAD13_03644 [Pseudovibrio sp. Ad13]
MSLKVRSKKADHEAGFLMVIIARSRSGVLHESCEFCLVVFFHFGHEA